MGRIIVVNIGTCLEIITTKLKLSTGQCKIYAPRITCFGLKCPQMTLNGPLTVEGDLYSQNKLFS